ncbi:Ribosomal protein S5/Elongation factor G/III/V family protein [Striga hermonthica]|uniref:Ribosomal protein S5/Elongation factor G/III/V family protein n=1 Tax=Striga hermonthica TaxID=68872 RepID=A0A9N7MHG1_STRHE|nr:Ribosomal protein S5/Elongation factor G/III/V family protein [Striga hermonthica]
MCIDDKESIVKKGTVEDAYIWMGEKLEIIDDVPCGNIVALAGLRRGNTGATVTSCEEVDAHVIRGMNFTVTPILRIDIKCTQINVKNCLVRRIERLQLLDPMVISSLDDDVTGLFIGGVGELHLQICRKDLQDNVASLGQMTSSSPVVSFRESVHLWSARTASVRSLSIQLCMKARPMKAGLAKAIDDGRIGPHDDPEARSKILEEEFGWDKELAKQIWCFGPYNTGPNILVNMCKEVKHLDKIKDLVVSGFQQASKQGPLFGEKMWGICFELRDAVIDHKIDPKNFVYKREIVSNTKKVMYAAYLLANPILLEPMYLVGIRAPECHLEIIYQAIYEKMGHVLEEAKMPCTPFYNVKAYLPVRKSLGFFTNLRARTSDQIFHQQVFDHWRVLYSDPLDPETEAGKLVVETRMKKGMGKMEKVSDYEK